jgi:signal transduction histidine kinase
MIDETSDNYVWADSRLLEMALSQLLDNASKYASPGSPITLRVISTDSEIMFNVQNEGSFVAPEERLRISFSASIGLPGLNIRLLEVASASRWPNALLKPTRAEYGLRVIRKQVQRSI